MTLRRRTPLQQRTPLVRRSSMRRTELARGTSELKRTEIQRRTEMKRGRVEPKLTKPQRDALTERSGGICEIQTLECVYVAVDPCHRVGEGSGGRHGEAAVVNDRLSNLLAGCRPCHDWCHRNPKAAQAERWMLRNGDDPLVEPVHYRRTSWRLLADDGTWELTSAPEDYREVA